MPLSKEHESILLERVEKIRPRAEHLAMPATTRP